MQTEFKKLALATAVSAVMAISSTTLMGCGGSSGNSSSDDSPKNQEPETTTFQFVVEQPVLGATAQNHASPAVKNLVNFLVPAALAADTVPQSRIKVAVVNAQGEVTQLIEPESISQAADGTYSLDVTEGERVDLVIVIEQSDDDTLEVGDTIDPSKFLFTPAVDSDEPAEINVGSSVAYIGFINAIGDFENISTDEVDNMMEVAQSLLEDANFSFTTLADLIEAITGKIGSQITLLANLAKLSPDTVTGGGEDIAADRLIIKSFFDDVNTIYQLSGFNADESEDDGAIEELAADAELTIATIESSAPALDALAEIGEAIADYASTVEDIPDTATTVTIGEILDDPQSLEGSIVYSKDEISATVTGGYKQIGFKDVSIVLTALDDEKEATFEISGELEDPDTLVKIIEGTITLNGNANNKAAKEEETQEDFVDGLTRAQVVLKAEVTGKDVRAAKDGVFTGEVDVVIVKPDNEFIEFAPRNGEEPVAELFYNIETVNVEGSFSFDGSSAKVTLDASSSNADSFVAPTQPYQYGDITTDIFSYSFDGSSELVLNTPDWTKTYSLVENKEYSSLLLKRGLSSFDWSLYRYGSDPAPTFKDYLADRYSSFYIDIFGLGSVEVDAGTFVDGVKNEIQDGLYYDLQEDYLHIYNDFGVTLFEVVLNDIVQIGDEYRFVGNYRSESYQRYDFTRFDDYLLDAEQSPIDTYWAELAYDDPDYFSGLYAIDVSKLVKGTESGSVTAHRLYESYDDEPETIELTYSWTENNFKYEFRGRVLHLELDEVLKHFEWDVRYQVDYTYGPSHDSELDLNQHLFYGNAFEDFAAYAYEAMSAHAGYDSYSSEVRNLGWFVIDEVPVVEGTDSNLKSTPAGVAVPLSARATEVNSLIGNENEENFRLVTATATIETDLERLGTTSITIDVDRTGYDDGVVAMTIGGVTDAQVTSDLEIAAAIADGELLELTISNDKGFTISKAQVIENEDKDQAWTMEYGLETATVEVVGFGLKVTYSDGTFDLY